MFQDGACVGVGDLTIVHVASDGGVREVSDDWRGRLERVLVDRGA
jgi:hypothetical protein